MSAPIVFFDIAGPETDQLRSFYSGVFGWDIGEDGQFSVNVTSPIDAAIRGDPKDKVIYIGVDDVTQTLERIESAGGSIDVPRFEVPDTVVLGLFHDPAGNRMGLVEMKEGAPVVP